MSGLLKKNHCAPAGEKADTGKAFSGRKKRELLLRGDQWRKEGKERR